MDKRKCLLLGEYTHPHFHPLQGIDKEITHILGDMMTVQCSENRKLLLEEHLAGYDLCIAYNELWSEHVSPQQTAGLLNYVSGGGGLIVLHTGISLASRYELAQLFGARFTGHPPYTELNFRPGEHVITEGLEPFTLEEEPYRFDFDPFTEKTVLLEYEHEGEWWPAAWSHSYGQGRVVFLMPGHHEPSFHHPAVRELLLRSAKWAARIPAQS
ncbi:ThuA domain-containing protein [Paenibacillus spiritus]|uniref:ThuA domain-containing protein n=1 Tax=Paenibacillus spiritus TaxID=2496557 RepID=A0A5J5GLA3_9BACL|nr:MULTISPECIES: ThuA domain-containing protein [Paenibacillus]KAA9008428.1 ThuA domain-containing protein [Paenibacillus spiritus]